MENMFLTLQDSLGNSQALVLALIFLAVVLFVMGGVVAFAGGDPVKRRMRTHVQGARLSKRFGSKGGNAVSKMSRNLTAKLAMPAGGQDAAKTSTLRRKMVQAGYMGRNAVGIFYLSRLLLAAVLPLSVLGILPIVAGAPTPGELMGTTLAAVLGGFYLPSLWVRHRINARQTEARQGFPDALDMLLVCVEAGLSLAAGLARVGKEITSARPMLGEHFRLVALEMQAGKSRDQALRNLAERIGIDEVRSLVTLLLQSEKLGTSIGQSLRVHAEEMRRKRLVKAEERANMIPAKMAIPLICFILPSLMSVIMTPLIIRYIRVIAPAMTGQ